jgi:hypothetical protein
MRRDMKYILALLLLCGGLKAADCGKNIIVLNVTASGKTLLVAAAGKQIRVCAVYFSVVQGNTLATFGLVAGNSTACSTNVENVTLPWDGVANSLQEGGQEIPSNAMLTATAGKDLCLNLSAAPVSATVQVVYDSF